MRILIACESSGTVREAFNKLGHDAWSCDLKETKIPGKHIKGDVLSLLNETRGTKSEIRSSWKYFPRLAAAMAQQWSCPWYR